MKSLIGSALFWVVGIIIVFLFLILLFSKSCGKDKNEKDTTTVNSESPSQSYTYPSVGKELATKEKPAKAFLDPINSDTRFYGDKEVIYVFEANPEIKFLCQEYSNEDELNKWCAMPVGNYLIYPKNKNSIVFEWW